MPAVRHPWSWCRCAHAVGFARRRRPGACRARAAGCRERWAPRRYELRSGTPVIVRLPAIDFVDDKAGKPVGIHKFIGKRPIAAFGNSDGDFEMLEWTTSAAGARLGVIVHHDDAAREFAYDRNSHVGRLARGLDEGPQRGWTIVSMKNDWKAIYPPPR
jgi:hypothetical protein